MERYHTTVPQAMMARLAPKSAQLPVASADTVNRKKTPPTIVLVPADDEEVLDALHQVAPAVR